MLATQAEEFEQILEEGEKFILSFTIGEKQGEEDGELTSSNHNLTGYLFC